VVEDIALLVNGLPVLISLTGLKENRTIADTATGKPLRASGNGGCSHLTAITEPTGSSYGRGWDDRPHCSSMTIRFYFQLAVQFVHALAHSGQADARFCACFTKSIQPLRRYAAAIISYFQNYLFKLVLEADLNLRSSRVPMYIRQALLEDTEKSNLYPDWESPLSGCNIQLYVDPGSLGETLDVPLRCASEADFIQQGWVQK
jgi:hypothetical protein